MVLCLCAGLRSIVKALLRSIRALKDAIVLTLFSVSIFALIGYQLFEGTLRQKCIRIHNATELAPYAFYVENCDNIPQYMSKLGTLNLTDMSATKHFCRHEDERTRKCTLNILTATNDGGSNPCGGLDGWNDQDLLAEILNQTRSHFKNLTTSSNLTDLNSVNVKSVNFTIGKTNFSPHSSYFAKKLNFECSSDCSINVNVLKMASFEYNCSDLNTTNTINCGNGSCQADIYGGGESGKTNLRLETKGDSQDENAYLYNLLCLREYMVTFHYERTDGSVDRKGDSRSKTLMYFIVKDELTEPEKLHWNDHTYNHYLKSFQNGLFYYVGSPNRPTPEPLYCPVGRYYIVYFKYFNI